MTEAVRALADRVGIRSGFTAIDGSWVKATPDTMRALLVAMGLPGGDGEVADYLAELQARDAGQTLPDWLVIGPDVPLRLPLAEGETWLLHREDGEAFEGRGPDLPPLPMGCHRLTVRTGECWLIASPPSLPDRGRSWGITLPLYGLRTATEGGLGDFGDLGVAVDRLASIGAGFVGINPIHAGFPARPDFFSPYAPSSRRRLNALHIAFGGDGSGRDSALVDYPASIATRLDAFRAQYAEGLTDPAFDSYLSAEGRDLDLFATHQAISAHHGAFWDSWPEPLRHPDSPEVAAFARAHAREIRFHAWLQWRAETELSSLAAKASGMRYGLYLDLAVGTHPHGAETWATPSQFARDVSLGAPPDAFSPDGQVWGLAPFNPLELIRDGFAPLAETLRCQLRFARLLRIDHVLGFERAYWVPEGLPGAYVTMPREAMLAVTRIEAARAEATIIGEDLGNIPDGLQSALRDSGILGCRVAQFERDWHGDRSYRTAIDYPGETLASFGTHDLPTWRGWREGRDILAREGIGQITPEAAQTARCERSGEVAAFDRVAGTGDGRLDGIDAFLAGTGSRLVALQIEDILDLPDQPNLPGTIDQYPNWRRRLPAGPEDFAGNHRLASAAETMALNGRKG